MVLCQGCDEEVDEVFAVKVEGRRRKLCEECCEEIELNQELAEASEAAIQQMMGFQGRR
ncbi:MAG: hypothetical protein MK135_02535 [Polyangiaceae bacterium]|nr:hypothetical protein [Polyangiaceae bacterium]